MDSGHHLRFDAQERSYLAILKKDVHALALAAGFPEARVADIDIVVAEMTSNLVKHAKGGEMLVRIDDAGMELIALDAGPGMSNVKLMAQDGISTTNTLGHGLGAISRLADESDLYSQKGWGTIALARFHRKPQPVLREPPFADIRSIVLPKPGEQACGDGFAVSVSDRYVKVMLGDGLGHGPVAQEVATKAERAFLSATSETSPVDLLRRMDEGVKRTRGLVAAVAVFDALNKAWRICGVGNINTWVGNARSSRGVMNYNGIVGVNMPNTLTDHAIPDEYGQLLILSSDGFRMRWDLQQYPFILRHDLSILAAALYKDFARRTDDMSILITRIHSRK